MIRGLFIKLIDRLTILFFEFIFMLNKKSKKRNDDKLICKVTI